MTSPLAFTVTCLPAVPASPAGELLAQRGHRVSDRAGRGEAGRAWRWPPPPSASVHARPTSTWPLDLADTCHWPASSSLRTTATSASSVRRSTSITDSAASSGRPYAARSARVTVVQTRPWPAAASGSSTARPSTAESRPRYPNGALSHSSCATAPGSMPVASSRAASSCTRGDVVGYLNEPVSVTSPAYRPNAMSRLIRHAEPADQVVREHRGRRRGRVDQVQRAEPGVGRVVVEHDQLAPPARRWPRAGRAGPRSRRRR